MAQEIITDACEDHLKDKLKSLFGWLESLGQKDKVELAYPRARIIVTSRPVGYKEQVLRDAGFAHFGIQDLGDGQIESFIRGWFALTFPNQPQQGGQRIQRVLGSVRQSRPIRLLAGNPMLLTIMALLAREQELPRERAKFYEKAVEVLCHHWDANRNLQLPEDRYLNADDKKALLRRIAMRMVTGQPYSLESSLQAAEAHEAAKADEADEAHEADEDRLKPGLQPGLKGNFIAEADLEQEIRAFLIDEHWQPGAAEARKAARRMIRQLRERNYILCLRGPHLYGFVHRTFLEYLTAAQYVRRFDRQPQQMTIDELIELFDRHCRDDDWREVLRLICGQIDEQYVGRIVEHLATRTDLEQWDGETPLPELPLAIWCLSEVRGTARLTSAGLQTQRKVIDCARRAQFGGQPFLMEQLLPACKELGERWPGRDRLVRFERTVLDGVRHVGSGEVFWPDFIASVLGSRDAVEWLAHATQGAFEGAYYRHAALQALAEKWPDETTRKLLQQRVGVDGVAASLLGGQHSEFGRIVFTSDLDGFGPYLDPAKPISREQIERAAEEANVPAERIDETVRSLSEHLGGGTSLRGDQAEGTRRRRGDRWG